MDRNFDNETRHSENGPPVIASTKARQGVISGRVRNVLLISVGLVVIAFAAIYVSGLI